MLKEAYSRASHLGLDDPQAMEFYGLVQLRFGKFSSAIDTLTGLLRVDPANERAKKFIQAARAQVGATVV